MATHSSIVAGIIPWTVESGRLPSVGHNELDPTEQLSLHITNSLIKTKE